MIPSQIIGALQLPGNSLVEQRIPKKTLIEQSMPTAADRRQIQDGIEELMWVAALKPSNIGVPVYRDDVREYLEISVLLLTLRPGAKEARLAELVHRTIPYPVFLVSSANNAVTISLTNKRFSEGQKDKYVVEESAQANMTAGDGMVNELAFVESLAIARLPKKDLYELYQGWMHRIAALQASRITGTFALPATSECAISVKQGLEAHSRLTREVQSLRLQAGKEKQLNRRVEMNLHIKRLETELASLADCLGGKEK